MIELRRVANRELLDIFIKLPFEIYRNDPFYSPLPIKEQRRYLSKENPFFRLEDVSLFVAFKDGRPAGRIASIINRRHIELHRENAGFFGLFESINDMEVTSVLVKAVSEILISKGLNIIRGPMNMSTNEQAGFLINGFDQPPMILTPYNPPYYNDLMLRMGMKKSKDLHAYLVNIQGVSMEKIERVSLIAQKRGVNVRTVNKKDLENDLMVFKTIYNESWKDNWGFIPLLDDEIKFMAYQLKSLIIPEMMVIAEYRGEPAGFLGIIPDYNNVLRVIRGRINPLTVIRAIIALKKIDRIRLLLLGVREEFRKMGIDAAMFSKVAREVKKRGYRVVECSWILEDNIDVRRLIEMAGGVLYKTFRIYEKEI